MGFLKPDYSKLFDFVRDSYSLISYRYKNGKAFIPLRYSLELTYKCNLNCPFCYVGDDRNKDELTTEEWLKVIEQIPFWGIITLVGGEPLIRKDFEEIFKKSVKRVNGRVNVVTNGVLLNEEIIKLFIKEKLLLLSVSIDGYGQTHDINRNKSGLFEKVADNLETLKKLKSKHKKPLLDIKTIIMKNNLDDLPKIYKMCDKLNADFLSLAFLRNNDLKQSSILRDHLGEEFYEQEYPVEQYFDLEHFEEIYKELKFLSKKGKTKIRFAPKFDFEETPEKIIKFFRNIGNENINDRYNPCLYPWSNTLITPEGGVYPCLSYKIGNIRQKPFIELWNSPKFVCFRKNLKARGVFNACQMCCELTPKGDYGG